MWGSGFRVRSLEFRAWGSWGCDHYFAICFAVLLVVFVLVVVFVATVTRAREQ